VGKGLFLQLSESNVPDSPIHNSFSRKQFDRLRLGQELKRLVQATGTEAICHKQLLPRAGHVGKGLFLQLSESNVPDSPEGYVLEVNDKDSLYNVPTCRSSGNNIPSGPDDASYQDGRHGRR